MKHKIISLLFLIFTSPSFSKPYDGKTLKVLSFRDNHSSALNQNIKEFEKISGAKVIFDMIATSAVISKINTDQLAGGTYDLYTVDEPFIPMLSNFLEPVSKWPKTEIFNIEENLEHTLQNALQSASYKDNTFGLPVSANIYMYVYRHDLINDQKEKVKFHTKYGYELSPPRNMKQMRDVAEFFYRPPQMYGFAPFTRKSEGTTIEAIWILGSFGTKFFDHNLNYVFNKQKAEEAFSFYKELMSFAPKGSKSWHHAERMACYSKGKIVQIMTWPSFVKGLENPNYSLVVDKNSYTSAPYTPEGWPSAVTGTWSATISKASKNKKLGAEFIAWWTDYKNAKSLVPKGLNPAREDLLSDQELKHDNPWFPGILTNFKNSVVRPRHPKYKMISDRISYHFTHMVAGMINPKEAAYELDKDIRLILGESI